MDKLVDVAIIGAGTSGMNALSQVQKAGKSFLLISGSNRIGSNSLQTRALIQAAEDYSHREDIDQYSIEIEEISG